MKRTEFPITEFTSNLRYKNVITRKGLSGRKLDLILNALDSKFSEDASMVPDQAAELIFHCCSLILRNQVPLTNLSQEIESKYKKLGDLKGEIDRYNDLRTESEANLKRRLEAANVTEFQLFYFTEIKAQLEAYGFELGDLTDIVMFMDDVKDFNGDAELMIRECKDIDSLQKKKIHLESQCDAIEKKLEMYKLREREAKQLWGCFYQGKLEFDRLLRIGLQALDIVQITYVLAKHYPKISLAQLIQEIEIYGDMESVNFRSKRHFERLDGTIHNSNPVEGLWILLVLTHDLTHDTC